MEIRVLDISGATKSVSVRAQGSVGDLSDGVSRAFDLAPARQRLICGGRIMHVKERLADYKLRSGSTVHLFPKSAAQAATARSRASDVEEGLSSSSSDGEDGGSDDNRVTRDLLRRYERRLETAGGARSAGAGVPRSYDADRSADLGSPRDFAWGFVMGFVLGFIMLLYLWERSVSHRSKLGIMAGASCQLLLKVAHDSSRP